MRERGGVLNRESSEFSGHGKLATVGSSLLSQHVLEYTIQLSQLLSHVMLVDMLVCSFFVTFLFHTFL